MKVLKFLGIHPTHTVCQPSEYELKPEFYNIVHYCSCMIKNKNYNQVFDFNHLYAFLQPKTDFYLQNNL